MKELRCPLIFLPADSGDILILPDGRKLRICFETQLSSYVGAVLIDQSGSCTVISAAERQGWGTWLWGWHPLLNKRLIRICVSFGDQKQLSLLEAKDRVLVHAHSKKSHWIKRLFRSRSELERLVNGASSFNSLIQVLNYDQD
jgi:hypothetical protein